MEELKPNPKFILKIDTQGNELNVLRQGQKVLECTEMCLIEFMFFSPYKTNYTFDDLVTFMTSGPVMIQALEGDNAVLKNRELMGATDPKNAKEGTIRKLYGISIDKNSVHGSDSIDNAKIEIDFFFND